MIPLATREESRAFDARAIDVAGVPSIVLMENAGRGAADAVIDLWAKNRAGNASGRACVVIACGTGNNGGDGFVVARHLLVRGHSATCFLFGKEEKLTKDARTNRDALTGVGGVFVAATVRSLAEACASADVVVDALFGTGLDRKIEGELAFAIEAINEANAHKVALDLPSGLDANTGDVHGIVVEADVTVTFGFHKVGLYTPKGRKFSGGVRLQDIGVPRALAATPGAHVSEHHDVLALLPPRALDAHKYSAGHVAVIAGSVGKLGASLLASHAALRAGAGAATIVTWKDAADALAARVTEVMTHPIDGADDSARNKSVDTALEGKRAVIIGPGLGLGPLARALVEHVIATAKCSVVVDADAITAFAGRAKALSAGAGRVVLTPHAGELARLLGVTSAEIEADRFGFVRRAAKVTGCIVLLKGPFTLVANPEGDVIVNDTGNAALATAGAGDVLSGIIGALACTLSPFEAAWAGAHLHGASADAWAAANGDRGLVAHEIAEGVPRAIRALASR